jgi:hypothetical protein
MWDLALSIIAAGASPRDALKDYEETQSELSGVGPDLSTEDGRKAEYERLLDSQNLVRQRIAEQAQRAP